MSDETTLITQAHVDYVRAHTAPEDEFLLELKRAARAEGIPAIWIAPEQATLMQILLRLKGARDVVEVGTLAGYSAIQMARALPPEGRVRTIEFKEQHADFAERWIARSDVAGKIAVLRGRGADVMQELADRTADATFLDADKTSYPIYLRESLRILRPGGMVLVDNAFAFGQLLDAKPRDSEVAAVRAFNDLMAAQAELQSVIVPVGDGLWVGVLR